MAISKSNRKRCKHFAASSLSHPFSYKKQNIIEKVYKYHDKKHFIDQVKMTEITCYIKRSSQQIINVTRKLIKNIQLLPISLRY